MTTPQKPIRVVPNELYIEPTSVCNLKCRMCYTNVINGPDRQVIPPERIMGLVRRFAETSDGPLSIYWCGSGEIFMHRELPAMVNEITERYGDRITQTVQTNGTVDRLHEIDSVERLHFRVSIDGQRGPHDWHRGEGTYDKCLSFCRGVLDRGSRHLTIRTLITRDNVYTIDAFHAELVDRLGPRFELALMIPLTNEDLRVVRPLSLAIARGDVDDSRTFPPAEARAIVKEMYAGRYATEVSSPEVTNYLSLTTYGVFSCCNGMVRLGDVDTEVPVLRDRLLHSQQECRDCSLFPCM